MFAGPVIGGAADRFGKFRVFALGMALSIAMVLVHTHLGSVSLPLSILVNVGFVVVASSLVSFMLLWRLQRDLGRTGITH